MQNKQLYRQLPQLLLPWYQQNARDLPWRRDREPYHVWLSEIMLQQTRVEAVRAYYERFLQRLPTVQALAEVSLEELFKLWEGLGYYNRARNLQKAAVVVVEEYGGVFPREYAQLLALPGVGAYTAGAVGSICFEMPTPAVDGNVLRVTARLTNDSGSIDTPAVKQAVTQQLAAVYPKGACGDFTQSLMELGALVCVPNTEPKCTACPLAKICLAKEKGTQRELPVKTPKKPRRKETLTVFLLECNGKTAVQKRTQPGVLCGMWELPNVTGELTAQQAVTQAAAWGCKAPQLNARLRRKHVFTHVEWDMLCFHIACESCPEQFAWKTEQQLTQETALPTAFKKLLEERRQA